MRQLITSDSRRTFVVLLLGLSLIACTNSSPVSTNQFSKHGSAPTANAFTVQDLTDHSVLVDVPAGEWRMVRLDRTFLPDSQAVQFIRASFPAQGAEPWVGTGTQLVRQGTDEPVSNARFRFEGMPGDISYASGISFTVVSAEEEVVLIFGSRRAPTRFYLGVVPSGGLTLPSADSPLALLLGPGETVSEFTAKNAQLANSLAERPLLTASTESGRGGFGASFIQYYLASGEVYKLRVGPLKVEESLMVDLPEGIKVQQKVLLQLDEPMPENGVFSYIGISVRQAGLCDWSYRVETPEFHRKNGSTYACASTFGPNEFVATDNSGAGITYGQPFHLYASLPTPPGTFKFEFSHTLTGRDGGRVQSYAGPASSQVFSGTGFFLGYINADFNKLYGWQTGPIEQPY